MNFKTFCYVYCIISFQILMVWGDTFIETFTGGRIKDYLSESADDYLNDKKLSERYKTIQLPKEWYIYIFLFSKKKKIN